MEDSAPFVEEMKQISEFSNWVSVNSVYLAGLLRNKTSLHLDQILEILIKAEEVSEMLSPKEFSTLQFTLYQGKTQEAVRLIGYYSGRSQNSQGSEAQNKLKSAVKFEEVKGKPYVKNEITGVVADPHAALKIKLASRASLSALEQEQFRQREHLRNQREIDRLESEELARRLQHEFDSEIFPETKPVQCMICLDTIREQDFLPLERCGHMFHPGCVLEHIETQIGDRLFPIVCPMPACKVDVSMLDLRERLSPDLMQKFEEFSFESYVSKNLAEVSCCPTPDCKFVFVIVANDNHLVCPLCNNEYCVRCRSDWHNGYTCEEFHKIRDPNELEKMFENFVNGQKFKKCPHCHFWVEKTSGCNHMACRCGKHFCYSCGGNYPCVNCIPAQR